MGPATGTGPCIITGRAGKVEFWERGIGHYKESVGSPLEELMQAIG